MALTPEKINSIVQDYLPPGFKSDVSYRISNDDFICRIKSESDDCVYLYPVFPLRPDYEHLNSEDNLKHIVQRALDAFFQRQNHADANSATPG